MALFLLLFSWAFAGGEVVIVLDNSGSMAWGGSTNGTQTPPNDPERIAVLGAQVVEGLARGSDDTVTLITFTRDGKSATKANVDQLRTLEYSSGTPLKAAVSGARGVFTGSSKKPKVLVLLTDGAPGDAQSPSEMKPLLEGTESQTVAISYFRDAGARSMGESYLRPLIDHPDDLHAIDPSQSDVVSQTLSAFTTSYARVLGSRPDTGSLAPGASHTFQAGRFVEEVLVAVASRDVGKIGAVTLQGPNGAVPIKASGDNGCDINWANDPKHCTGNRRTFATFRVAHDPDRPGSYTLTMPSTVNAEYGIILKYGLVAVLQAPPSVRMGDEVILRAHLQAKGKIVDAPEILESPGFTVSVRVGTEDVVLKHEGGGKFVGSFTPSQPGAKFGEVSFKNAWLDKRARSPLSVEGFVPLNLKVPPVDLGSWSGSRASSERCQELDFSQSTNHDKVALQCDATAPLTCTELSKGKWEVCARMSSCCGAAPAAGDGVSVRIAGKHPHYAAGAATVPVIYKVSGTGFLRCWWLVIAILLGLMFTMFVLYGFFYGRSFDPALSVKIAGREAALRRATATGLSEAPGGKRGWYRHARFGLTNDGHPTRKKGQAQLLLVAGPRRSAVLTAGAGLEMQNRRNRKWEPVPLGEQILPGSTYRIGDMYLKFS